MRSFPRQKIGFSSSWWWHLEQLATRVVRVKLNRATAVTGGKFAATPIELFAAIGSVYFTLAAAGIAGNRQQATGNSRGNFSLQQQATDSKQQHRKFFSSATGNRQQTTGTRSNSTGNFSP
ncbi:MAG: hypothetical protein ACRC62_05600 [Microcoleus sp.]